MEKRGNLNIRRIKILVVIVGIIVLLLGFIILKNLGKSGVSKEEVIETDQSNFIKKAVLEDDIGLCEQAEDKEKCLLNFALYKRDITLCDRLKNKENVEYCKEQIKFDGILEEGDFERCEELTILKENCYSLLIEEFNLENEA